MARGKHSTALFEVINSGKKPPGGLKSSTGKPLEGKAAAASLIKTPKWWFKGASKEMKKPEAPPAVVSNDPTANVTAATLSGPRSAIAPSAASAPSPEPVDDQPDETAVVVRDYSDPEPAVVGQIVEAEPEEVAFIDRPDSPQAGSMRGRAIVPAPEPDPAAPLARTRPPQSSRRDEPRSSVHFGVDRDRQEITVRMRYTAAVVGSFVVLVAIGSAYVVGRHLGESVSNERARTAQQINGAPPQPGVLDVKAHLASAKLNGSGPSAKVDPDPSIEAPIDSAGIADRTAYPNYLNFVLITTFPPEKSEMAIRARDFLCSHGITCTLERGVPGQAATWLSVVGVRGFPRKFKDSPQYLAYHDAIIALNNQFPAKSNFGRFNPMPFKWDGH